MYEFEGQTIEPGLPEDMFSFIILNPLYYVSLVINSLRVSKSAEVHCGPWTLTPQSLMNKTWHSLLPQCRKHISQNMKTILIVFKAEREHREFLMGVHNVEEEELLLTADTTGIRLYLRLQSQWFFEIFEVVSKRISSNPPTHPPTSYLNRTTQIQTHAQMHHMLWPEMVVWMGVS